MIPSLPTEPIQDGIATGDLWQNEDNPRDCGFILSLEWGLDDYQEEGWFARFFWLNSQVTNRVLVKRLMGYECYRRIALASL